MTKLFEADDSSQETLLDALLRFQGLGIVIGKSDYNSLFKSSYAQLGTILTAIAQPLAQCGLVVSHTVERDDSGHVMVTTLYHAKSKGSMSITMPINAISVLVNRGSGNGGERYEVTSQAFGSAVTYARRYSLCALLSLNVDDDDDDGNSASGTPAYAGKQSNAGKQPKTSPVKAKHETNLVDANQSPIPETEEDRVRLYSEKIVNAEIKNLDQLQKFESAIIRHISTGAIGKSNASKLLKEVLVHAVFGFPLADIAAVLGNRSVALVKSGMLTDKDRDEVFRELEIRLQEEA